MSDISNPKVLPLFKSHYSIGKSILTLEISEKKNNSPVSIFSLAKEASLKEVVIVEDNFSGFLEAFKNAKASKLKLIYGIRMYLTESIEDKTVEAECKRSKIIIFIKNTDGYNDLCKIWSVASSKGLYSKNNNYVKMPHIDYQNIKKLWTKNLKLAIPFYDSFIHMNVLDCGTCVPDFSFAKPIFFVEDNNLPFDNFILAKLNSYVKSMNYETVETKTIYYENREDYIAYITARCINNRSTIEKPDLNHMCSDEFCFESWKEVAYV
jgi:DNA polymerase III alpha subunit